MTAVQGLYTDLPTIRLEEMHEVKWLKLTVVYIEKNKEKELEGEEVTTLKEQ